MKDPSVMTLFSCEDNLPHDPRCLLLTDAPSLAEAENILAGLGALKDEDDVVIGVEPLQEPADVGASCGP